MKYKDIPQFTRDGNWASDMDPRYLMQWIESEQAEAGLQLEPDFQRGHVWTEAQQIAYLEYLLRGGKSGRDLYFNCSFGANGLPKGEGYEEYVCVDGLQRIIAWKRYLNNEIPVFGHFCREFTDRFPIRLSMRVYINDLKTRREVLQWYIDMNAGGTPHSEAEISRVRALLEQEEK